MSTANSREILAPTMRTEQFIAHDPSGVVGGLTGSLLGLWPKGTTAKNKSVQKNRARIMWGGMLNPVDILYRMLLSAIDEGKDGIQWAKDIVSSLERYKARHVRRQSLGVIPIGEAHDRMLVAAIREDAEADCKEATVDLDSIDSLEAARAERLEAMNKDERKVVFYTARLAELRAKGA